MLPTEWQNHSWRWDCQGHISLNWTGDPPGEVSKCMSGKTTVFYKFLGHSHLSEIVSPPKPSLLPPSPPLYLPSSSVWCVFYVKSMVSGHCGSKSKPVVKTNFIYHRGVPGIIITPAQQLRLWIHNQTKVGRTKCSKVAIQVSNVNGWEMIVER